MSSSFRAEKIAVAIAVLAGSVTLVLTAWALWAFWPPPGIDAIGGARVVLEMDRSGLAQQNVAPREAIDQSVMIMATRLRELAAANGKVVRDGEDRVVIDVPGVTDPDRLKTLADTIGKPGKLEFRMVDSVEPYAPKRVPSDSEVLEERRGADAVKLVVKKRALLDGADLTDAQAAFDALGQPVVRFKFNNIGARKFGRATQENVGRQFAIVIDGEVISAPVIREPILGGHGQISGNFTVESASSLAILLRAGALPASFKLVEIRQVPPASARH